MGYMRSFYEDNHFWELAPTKRPMWATCLPTMLRWQPPTRTRASSRYFGDTVRQKLAIEGVDGAAYASRWFNPRTGAYRDGEDRPCRHGQHYPA